MPSSSSLLPASSVCRSFLLLSSFGSSPVVASIPLLRHSSRHFLLLRSVPPLRHGCSSRMLYSFARPVLVSAAFSFSASAAAVDRLPSKLAEIIKLFQIVPEPRAKYEQLLHYGKKLHPLPKEFQTTENKVQGCVSQVWVRATIDQDKRMYFEAESDSVLTKGLAALLVEGLSGSLAADILRISPDFIQMLGLNQSLTPSRSNGFLNMFKLMQKKTLELVMESEGVRPLDSRPLELVMESEGVRPLDSRPVHGEISDVGKIEENVKAFTRHINGDTTEGVKSEGMTRKQSIMKKLEMALDPIVLEVEDVSYQHAGHAGVERGASETHFNLKIVSPMFEGKTLVKRHRLIYELLTEELKSGLHALSIVAKTPSEAEKF